MLAEGRRRSWGENSAPHPPAARPRSPKRLHAGGAEGESAAQPRTEAAWGRQALVTIPVFQGGSAGTISEGLPLTEVSSRPQGITRYPAGQGLGG